MAGKACAWVLNCGFGGCAGVYLFGFQGQEIENEIYGEGNSYFAKYWQYDARIGKRWNIDPVVKHHESPYATFANNPILFIDPYGADSIHFAQRTNDMGKLEIIENYTQDDNPSLTIWAQDEDNGIANWNNIPDIVVTATRISKPKQKRGWSLSNVGNPNNDGYTGIWNNDNWEGYDGMMKYGAPTAIYTIGTVITGGYYAAGNSVFSVGSLYMVGLKGTVSAGSQVLSAGSQGRAEFGFWGSLDVFDLGLDMFATPGFGAYAGGLVDWTPFHKTSHFSMLGSKSTSDFAVDFTLGYAFDSFGGRSENFMNKGNNLPMLLQNYNSVMIETTKTMFKYPTIATVKANK